MIYEVSTLAIIRFLFIVGLVLGLSFYFARKTKSAAGYYAAVNQIEQDRIAIAAFLVIRALVRRKGRVYIINKQNPRYKARQG